LAEIEKSAWFAPDSEVPVNDTGALLTFVSTTSRVEAEFTATFPKFSGRGAMLIAVPVPERFAANVPTPGIVTLRIPVRVPMAVGVKVRLYVQLFPAAREVPHVVPTI
jgi:hypothetical protein